MSTPKVLLVDDVNMFLELEKSFLKLSPVRVLTARDGVEALEVVKAERPDLIFMDLNMPKMTGAECCALIKADQELKSIPVVIITTAGKQEDRELCAKAGCDEFLTKPVERKSFLEVARKYLQTVERREFRISCKFPATFACRGASFAGDILDISERGAYLATDSELPIGAVLDVSFPISEETGNQVETKSRVVWVNSKAEHKKPSLPEGVGIEFVTLPEPALEAIKKFIVRRGPVV